MAKTSTARSQPKKKSSAPSRKAAKSIAPKSTPKKATAKKTGVKKTAPKKATAQKAAVKKPAVKKPAAKTVAAKKPTPKKAVATKSATIKTARKTVAAKPTQRNKAQPKKAAAKKVAAKTPAKKAPRVTKARAPKVPAKAASHARSPASKGRAFRKTELATFRIMLQKQLELIQGNIDALAGDNIKRSPNDTTQGISSHSTHMADHGTENFERELALSLASSRQDSVYAIEDAIRRIDEGEYGTCQVCEKPIERPRLKALPFAKTCVACQNAAERGRSRLQPFKTHYPVPPRFPDDSADTSDS